MSQALPERARAAEVVPGGRYFEDFHEGQTFAHRWGRTVCRSEATMYSSVTQAFNQIYFNVERAQERGYQDIVVSPMHVLAVVVGLSVEDLSEVGGAFLGLDEVVFISCLIVGETVHAESAVLTTRLSNSIPGHGIVTWKTRGLAAEGRPVIQLIRTNLLPLRG